MILNQEQIRRMTGGAGGSVLGGGGSTDQSSLIGVATQAWVNENYLSIEFFSKLFKAYDSAATPNEVLPNDTASTITNIKAMFGFWTEQYISALGQNASGGGGGGGGSTTLADLLDVELTTPADGQVLTYYNGKWRNLSAQGISMATVWAALADTTTTEQIALSHLTTALTGYATQTWVGQQGFLTSADLTGYATQQWVGQQGYLTGITSTMVTTALGYTPLASTTTWWGQTVSNGAVTGSLTGVVQIDMTGHLIMHSGGTGIYLNSDGTGIDWHDANGDYVSSLLAFTSGQVQFNQDAYIPAAKILRIGDAVFEWDSTNNAVKVRKASGANDAVNLYATGGVSAIGLNTIATDGTVSASMCPSTTAEYDLGSSSLKWRDLYMSGRGTNFSIINYSSYTYFGTSNYFNFGADILIEYNGLHIGTRNTNYDLYVNGENGGNGYFVGNVSAASITNRSDLRLKDIIDNVELSVESLAYAPLFRYTFKNGDERVMVGTSAQYWNVVLPQAVSEDPEGMLGLDYGVTALAGVISMAREVVEHERRIAKLEAENATLRAELDELKAA